MTTGSGPSHMAGTPAKSRIIGVDVARGIALAGMLAVHVFYTFNSDGSPAIATELASGRSAAIFAVMAGVGLALVTGGRYPVKGAARVAASAGLAVRGLLICLIGLTLGYASNAAGLDVYLILPYYAVMFLLAIPLLGLGPRVLAGIAVVLAVSAGALLNVTIGNVANPRWREGDRPERSHAGRSFAPGHYMNTGAAVPTRTRPHHNSLIGVKCPDDGPMRRLMPLGRRYSRGATGEGQFNETLVSIGWAAVAAATLALAGFNRITNAASWLVAYRPFQSTPDLPDSSLRHSS